MIGSHCVYYYLCLLLLCLRAGVAMARAMRFSGRPSVLMSARPYVQLLEQMATWNLRNTLKNSPITAQCHGDFTKHAFGSN